MGKSRNWTQEEYEYLKDNWGYVSLPSIAAHLNRSVNGVKIKAQRLGLGAFLDSGDYVTANQLFNAIGKTGGTGYADYSWIQKRGFPVKYKTVDNCRFKIVYIEEFWRWTERHRNFIDWSRFEPLSLGKEPEWVKEQRRLCVETKSKYRSTPWTQEEDSRLKMLLKQHRYTIDEISKRLGRTAGAIQRRCCDLRVKERPVKAENHTKWTQEEYLQLGEQIKAGCSYELMSEKLHKSSKAIRGRVYAMYLTENLDKARYLIDGGHWGDNRPDRPITNTTLDTSERQQVKQNLSILAGILRAHAAEIGYDTYWQKDMCQHWEGYCTADQIDCDSCTCFQRIKEQYCRRCGKTFYERQTNDCCNGCRSARKKQAQKKFAILSRRHAG